MTPQEVLSLTRWSDDEGTDHLARAFAFTILCIDTTSMAPKFETPETALPQLRDSCLRFGHEALAILPGLVVALLESRDEDDDAPLLWFGLLLYAAVVDPTDPRLPALVARVDLRPSPPTVTFAPTAIEGSMESAMHCHASGELPRLRGERLPKKFAA